MFLRLDNIARSIQFRHARDKVSHIPPPPLARSALDRDYLMRANPELFSILRSQPNARALLMHQGKALGAKNGSLALDLSPVALAPESAIEVFLGTSTGSVGELPSQTPIVLVVLDQAQAEMIEPDPVRWISLRRAGAGLSDLDAGIFTEALALNNWHQNNPHCPACGNQTVIEQGGWVRRCVKDGTELYPRTDPAIIVSIIDQDDRILLGSQGTWEKNRWSILAGFVEQGESLEAAVIREMKEESGLLVTDPKYIYSQSWPFPCSLMLGFSARADSSAELAPDGDEIVSLRWFSRAELAAEAHQILLPGKSSISRAMIELWFGNEIVSAAENAGDDKL
jgi:NAD+ diphosphatase